MKLVNEGFMENSKNIGERREPLVIRYDLIGKQ